MQNATMTTPEVQASRRKSARSAARSAADPNRARKTKDAGRVKTTIVMDTSLDFRLGSLAGHLQKDRSELARQLIDQGLRKYALDDVLRQFLDRQDQASEISCSATSAA